ncbi:hypothetical protein ACFYMW_30670 [Streptomyces sp. NPDC006692]|uniref:hypothetical protein n=1 Tax=Streptomyces sp. NPDC006692 TaxID=3364758 RepID=UPI0036B3585A
MTTSAMTALISASIAVVGACIALYAARGNSARAGFDLARALYDSLTSEDTARSRSNLEFYRRSGDCGDGGKAKEAMDHYFRLLWRFEQVHAGRQSLMRQRRINGTGPAVRFLDDMIGWHVREWANRWLDIRSQIEAARGERVDDEHSLDTFCQLLAAIEPDHWKRPSLDEAVAQQKESRWQRERGERDRAAGTPSTRT